MIVTRKSALELYSLIQENSFAHLQQLNSQEKKAVMCMLKILENGDSCAEIKRFKSTDFSFLKAKLNKHKEAELLPKTPFSLNQILYYLLSFISLEVSPSSILQKVKIVGQILEKNKNERAHLEESLTKYRKEIEDLISLVEFKKSFLIDVYQDLAKFYEILPVQQEDARPLLQAKVAEIEERIKLIKNSADSDSKSKLYTLEKEILANLKKMTSYKGNQWNIELKTNQEVWKRTAQNTQDFTQEKILIEDYRSKIEKLLIKSHL